MTRRKWPPLWPISSSLRLACRVVRGYRAPAPAIFLNLIAPPILYAAIQFTSRNVPAAITPMDRAFAAIFRPPILATSFPRYGARFLQRRRWDGSANYGGELCPLQHAPRC